MTTIAWDGHSLAADKAAWTGGRIYHNNKLHVVELLQDSMWGQKGDKLMVAHMGSAYANERVRRWLAGEDGWNGELNLADTGHGGSDVIAAIIDKHRRVWDLSPYGHRCHIGCARRPEHRSSYDPDYFAGWGAGGAFAAGALASGETAEKAVRLAIDYTDFAAVGVDVLHWKEVFRDFTDDLPVQSDDIPY